MRLGSTHQINIELPQDLLSAYRLRPKESSGFKSIMLMPMCLHVIFLFLEGFVPYNVSRCFPFTLYSTSISEPIYYAQ